MDHLSPELIDRITIHCSTNQDRARLGACNRQLYHHTRRQLFRSLTMTNPRQCVTFLAHMDSFLERGYMAYVRQLDLSSYTIRGSGWTEAQAREKLTAKQVARWIMGCSLLQQLVIGDELMYIFMDPALMRAVFSPLHRHLKVIDLAGFCDQKVTQAMADLLLERRAITKKDDGEISENDAMSDANDGNDDNDGHDQQDDMMAMMLQTSEHTEMVAQQAMPPQLTQLSFHMCMALSPTRFFQPLFQQLQHHTLTRLDLAYTPVTNQVLQYLHPEQLTHLNLQGCRSLHCHHHNNHHEKKPQARGLAAFLADCTNLVELNLNIHFNGTAMGHQFCRACLQKWVKRDMRHLTRLRVLDLGGHAHLDDALLNAMPTHILQKLRYFSLAYVPAITYDALVNTLQKMKQLEYLNVTRVRALQLTPKITRIPALLQHCSEKQPRLVVIEADGQQQQKATLAIPRAQASLWSYHQHGRRGYYARDHVDPRFKYSQKLLLLDQQPESPMMKYWSFY